MPKGVAPSGDDQIIYDFKDGKSVGGFGHASCGADALIKELPPVQKASH